SCVGRTAEEDDAAEAPGAFHRGGRAIGVFQNDLRQAGIRGLRRGRLQKLKGPIKAGGTEGAGRGIIPDRDNGMVVVLVLQREILFVLVGLATRGSESSRKK